jgi:TolB protein
MRPRAVLASALAACALLVGHAQQQQPPPPPPTPPPQGQQPPPATPQQPTGVRTDIYGESGTGPRLAVPDFIALAGNAGDIGRTIGQVLWDDLQFEREYYLIPRNQHGSIPAAASIDAAPLDRWRELGAEFVVIGGVRHNASSVTVTVRLYQTSTGQVVFGKEYTGQASNPRLYAHTISDEIHQTQRGLVGVARTKLTFSSDRDGERTRGPLADRTIKEIYIADYDGANQRRVTANRSLAITPVWSPDGRAIAYTSYRRGFPDIYLSYIYQGRLEDPGNGNDRVHNFLPAISPDGRRIAFMSNRHGNPEIYAMNMDGTNVVRLTNHPANDVTPTWSPGGNEVAFTSDRSGSPQIYVTSGDGLGQARRLTSESFCDRATWSPPPFNEIAYASRTGSGYDIKVMDVASGTIRQITDSQGSNESPAWAPNGRHLSFTSKRTGRPHIFTVARDGNGLRQVTKAGGNYTPNWSR